MEAVQRTYLSHDWVNAVFLLILFLWLAAHFIDKKRFSRWVRLPWDDLYMTEYKDTKAGIFELVLFVASLLTWSMVILKTAVLYGIFTLDVFSYMKILFLLGIFFVVKYMMEWMIARIFGYRKLFVRSMYVKVNYWNALSLYLTFFSLLMYYTFSRSRIYMLITGIFFAVLLIQRYYYFVRMYKNIIRSRIFYFILYFCTLEVIPVILLVKTGI